VANTTVQSTPCRCHRQSGGHWPHNEEVTVVDDVMRLADLGDEELFLRLGADLYGESRDVSAGAANRLRQRAERWLETWLDSSREAICNHPAVVSIRTEEGATQLQEAAALIDAVGSLRSLPPVATVTAILLKRGLPKICAS
jgi:hypothetical protein